MVNDAANVKPIQFTLRLFSKAQASREV